MNAKRAVLLIGSPRTPANSEALGDALGGMLKDTGWAIEKVRVTEAVRSRAGMDSLVATISGSGLFILSAPLYADGVPAMVLRVFSEIARAREALPRPSGLARTRMTALFNCGFPESRQNEVALDICALFAADAGFDWAGGLGMGMGGLIDQRPLQEAGGALQPIRRALALAAEALDRGENIPAEAARLMAGPVIPGWLYFIAGNWGSRWQAWKNRVPLRDLYKRPFHMECG